MKKYNVSIIGATGVVGLEVIKILEERRFPVNKIRLFASANSKGHRIRFKGINLTVQTINDESFRETDIAFFSAGEKVSKEWAPKAVASGAIVIDKTSAFRMEKNVPLVVPEVNKNMIKTHKGIISNPNCVAIPLVVALKPLHDYGCIKRVVVTTFQAVSGAGLKAVYEMEEETKSQIRELDFNSTNRIFPHQIAFNVIPQIPQRNAFKDGTYTGEEIKVINETKKIMGDDSIKITITCVRVPVYRCHSESINIETLKPITPAKAQSILSKAPGIKVLDEPSKELYPTPAEIAGTDEVFVGRIRRDDTIKNGLNLWVVADNLRKGAALNAIQIAEFLAKK